MVLSGTLKVPTPDLRKLLLIFVLLPILGGLGWWYFGERPLPANGPSYREYAYVSNGKSNTVSVIDLRSFEPAKTIKVGLEPTGLAANNKKNEVYAVNTASDNISVINAEENVVVATKVLGLTGTKGANSTGASTIVFRSGGSGCSPSESLSQLTPGPP